MRDGGDPGYIENRDQDDFIQDFFEGDEFDPMEFDSFGEPISDSTGTEEEYAELDFNDIPERDDHGQWPDA